MSLTAVSQSTSADGQWVTTTYSDGTTMVSPAPGSSTATVAANATTLQQRAQQALTNNATFQAIASPTNAQNAAQVQALTKQCNGIIRLLLNQFDSITGT